MNWLKETKNETSLEKKLKDLYAYTEIPWGITLAFGILIGILIRYLI
jgi:hypothetical protein